MVVQTAANNLSASQRARFSWLVLSEMLQAVAVAGWAGWGMMWGIACDTSPRCVTKRENRGESTVESEVERGWRAAGGRD